MRERELCLAGALRSGELTYNYTPAEDGCPGPEDVERWTARRVPTPLLRAEEAAADSDDVCP